MIQNQSDEFRRGQIDGLQEAATECLRLADQFPQDTPAYKTAATMIYLIRDRRKGEACENSSVRTVLE